MSQMGYFKAVHAGKEELNTELFSKYLKIILKFVIHEIVW